VGNTRIFKSSGIIMSTMIVNEVVWGFNGARDTRKGLVLKIFNSSARHEVNGQVARVRQAVKLVKGR
jgi:hypothetical protein